jgi:hypothetical protein
MLKELSTWQLRLTLPDLSEMPSLDARDLPG